MFVREGGLVTGCLQLWDYTGVWGILFDIFVLRLKIHARIQVKFNSKLGLSMAIYRRAYFGTTAYVMNMNSIWNRYEFDMYDGKDGW